MNIGLFKRVPCNGMAPERGFSSRNSRIVRACVEYCLITFESKTIPPTWGIQPTFARCSQRRVPFSVYKPLTTCPGGNKARLRTYPCAAVGPILARKRSRGRVACYVLAAARKGKGQR